jgi:glyoxylase-like metal-dependent hydrolase (beta-lactamase superfamily II)
MRRSEAGDVIVAASDYVRTRRVGDVAVTAINDATFVLPVELTVPEAQWRRELDVDAEGKIAADSHVLLVQADGATILIDAGLDEPGSDQAQPFLEEWPGSWRTPGVIAGLASVGVKPAEITHVLVTHTHFDHVAGLAVELDGVFVPRYPNAQVLLGRADWENAPEEHLGPGQRARIGAVAEAGLLDLLEGEREIVPGVTMVPAPGESPGHSIVRIASKGASLYAVGDLFHFGAEVRHPDWMVPWADPEQMRASRSKLLEEAVSTGALVVFSHENFPPWGHIVRNEGGGFRWERA